MFRLLISPQITLSVSGLSLVNPPSLYLLSPPKKIFAKSPFRSGGDSGDGGGTKKGLVLLSVSVEIFFVSHIKGFFLNSM